VSLAFGRLAPVGAIKNFGTRQSIFRINQQNYLMSLWQTNIARTILRRGVIKAMVLHKYIVLSNASLAAGLTVLHLLSKAK
jgi:hypothetical protein